MIKVFLTFVDVFICATSPGQTKNDTDLIFGTHTRIDLILKPVFCFAEKIFVTAACLEKLPCHLFFPHISSIALYLFKFLGAKFQTSLILFNVIHSPELFSRNIAKILTVPNHILLIHRIFIFIIHF